MTPHSTGFINARLAQRGVRYVVVPVGARSMPRMELSVSDPDSRLNDDFVKCAVPLLCATGYRPTREIDRGTKV